MREDDPSTSRRSVLRSLGVAGVASVAGLSGAAAAGGTAQQSRADVTETLRSHAGDVLDTLAADGIIESADLDEFRTDRHLSLGDLAKRHEGTAVVTTDVAGVSTRSVRAVTAVEGGVVVLAVEPGTGRSYAVFESAGEGGPRLYAPDARIDDGVSFDDVEGTATTECTDEQCDIVTCIGEVTRCVFGYCVTTYECICGC